MSEMSLHCRELFKKKGRAVVVQKVGPMFQLMFTDQPTIRDYREFCQHVDRAAFQKFVKERIPADCTVEFHAHGGSPAIQLSYDSPFLAKAKNALSDEWPKPAVTTGSGGSIPVVGDFQTYLGMESLLVGFGGKVRLR